MQQTVCPSNYAAGQQFDVPFLKLELQRCGLEAPSSWLWADSLKFARKQWPEVPPDRRYGLQLLRAHFGLPEGEVGLHIRLLPPANMSQACSQLVLQLADPPDLN
jgi:DNA polymerase III epsilon subunit-like protein